MKRKIVSILLCLAVCMTMMPTGAWADGTESAATTTYNWTVAGVLVTSANADNIIGDGIKVKEGGKVSYNPDTNTLTLNNATIINNNKEDGIGIKCANGNNKPPTIVIEGDNKINASSHGIVPLDNTVSNLTIKSEDGGSLIVQGTNGINCENLSDTVVSLTLSNVKVEATGTNGHGISTKGDITLENAVVEATGTFTEGTDNGNYCGIKSDGTLTLTKSSITAKRGNGYSCNIEAKDGIFAKDAEITGEYYSDTKNVFTSGETKKLRSDNEITLRNNFEEYGLWVGGVQVTEKNAANITGTGISTTDGGEVSYDATSNTLTLNNAAITGSHTDGYKSAAVMAVQDDINIKIIGTNTITNPTTSTDENTTSYGIYTSQNISVTNDSATDSADTVTIKSDADAIHAGKDTTISNVTVTATSTNGNGIDSFNNITLTNANVIAKGVNGIQSGYIITTSENAIVKAEGTTGYGIAAGNNITFNNSDIEAKCNSGNAIASENGNIKCTAEMSPMKNGKNVDSEDGFNHIIRAISAGDWVSLKRTTNSLYYNTTDGKVYTSYDEDTKKFDVEWDRGGIAGSGNTLTLKDLYFVTTADKALVIPGMTKEDTITINCEGENTIRAGYGGSTGTCGIQTNANLVINGELTMAFSNIKVQGDLQLVDADVVVYKAITEGKLILENAILETRGYSQEDPYSIVTGKGIYYYNNLYGSKVDDAETACETLPDSNIVSKLGNSFFTLHAEAFADFHANEGEWKDRTGTAYTLERIRSEEKQDGKRWITLPDTPTRDGYNFVGWFTEAEGGTQITGDKVQYNREETATALLKDYDRSGYSDDAANTYYAHWEIDTHNWSTDWTSDETHHWHKCTDEGCDAKKDYAEHSGTDDGNCNTSVTCDCGYEITAAQSHNYPDTWTAVRPGSTHTKECQNPGCRIAQTGSCTSDGKATCQEFAKCTVCGGDCGTKADHRFTAETVGDDYLKSAATCEAKAVYYKSCSVCGLSSKDWAGEATFESGEPNNHSFGDWTITKQPTATEKGSKERVCSLCQHKETAEIPATGGGSTSGGGSTVAPVQKPEIQPVSGGKTSLSKDGSTLTITPDEGMEIGTVTVNGKEVTVKDGKITGLKTGDKVQVTFKAKAPSKEEMDQKVAETVKNLSLTVRTSRTENRNVRAVVQMDSELNAAVQEFKAAGYTVKYKFYRSTKKASGFKRMLTKDMRAYVNTMGEKGTYYYYKARLAVYDAEGKLIAQTALKQCKAGNRLWVQ